MIFRYYLQKHAELKPSLRRYTDTTAQRWEKTGWTGDCAREPACKLTNDLRLTEEQAEQFIGRAA